jgi:hypothetical protein
LIKKPSGVRGPQPADDDVLSNVLRSVRLTGSLQFLLHADGDLADRGQGRAIQPRR